MVICMALGLSLIVLEVLFIGITTSHIAKENERINWIEVFLYPIDLMLCMILGHIMLPEFLILVGLVYII